MEQVGFLNLEYLFYTIYRVFSDTDVSDLSARFGAWVNLAELVGLILSFILLVSLIYVKMRASQAHHALIHAREEQMHAHGDASVAKNDRWHHVVQLSNSSNPSDWRQAILESDIILGLMLDSLQIPGDSIGEKLKVVDRSHFSTLDLAWEAHKVRNEIAHAGSTFELTQREARRILDLYRRVFEEFDYI